MVHHGCDKKIFAILTCNLASIAQFASSPVPCEPNQVGMAGSAHPVLDWCQAARQPRPLHSIIDRGSEWRLRRMWFEQSAMGDLLGADYGLVEIPSIKFSVTVRRRARLRVQSRLVATAMASMPFQRQVGQFCCAICRTPTGRQGSGMHGGKGGKEGHRRLFFADRGVERCRAP